MTTSTTSIKVMEDYSPIAFVQAFTRFACEVGYPQFMLIDEGSQLVKVCESMRLTFTDIKNKLHKDTMVTFDTCPVDYAESYYLISVSIIQYSHNYVFLFLSRKFALNCCLLKFEHNIVQKLLELSNYFTIFIDFTHCSLNACD